MSFSKWTAPLQYIFYIYRFFFPAQVLPKHISQPPPFISLDSSSSPHPHPFGLHMGIDENYNRTVLSFSFHSEVPNFMLFFPPSSDCYSGSKINCKIPGYDEKDPLIWSKMPLPACLNVLPYSLKRNPQHGQVMSYLSISSYFISPAHSQP